MDTEYLHQALRNWQERNHTSLAWDQLSQKRQSEILGDAQKLKTNARKIAPLTIDEVVSGWNGGQ